MIIGRRINGSIYGKANPPTTTAAKGLWSVINVMVAKLKGIWPA